MHAEWTKLRTLPGNAWLLAALIIVTISLGTAADRTVHCHADGCGIDPAKVALTGTYLGQAVVAVAGVLAVGDEYSTGLVKLSLTAMPRRLTWLCAKAAALTASVLIASTMAVTGSAVAGQLILPTRGLTTAHGYVSLTTGLDVRAAAGTIAYLMLIGLLSLGIATTVRDSGAAIGLALGILYLIPIAASLVGNATLARHLQQIAPLTAGLDIQGTTAINNLPLTPGQGLGVVALWTLGALIIGGLAVKFRDV